MGPPHQQQAQGRKQQGRGLAPWLPPLAPLVRVYNERAKTRLTMRDCQLSIGGLGTQEQVWAVEVKGLFPVTLLGCSLVGAGITAVFCSVVARDVQVSSPVGVAVDLTSTGPTRFSRLKLSHKRLLGLELLPLLLVQASQKEMQIEDSQLITGGRGSSPADGWGGVGWSESRPCIECSRKGYNMSCRCRQPCIGSADTELNWFYAARLHTAGCPAQPRALPPSPHPGCWGGCA